MYDVDRHKSRLGGNDSIDSTVYNINRAKRNLSPTNDLSDWKCKSADPNAHGSIGTVTDTTVTLGSGKSYRDNTMRRPCSAFNDNVHGDTLPNTPTVLTGCCDDWQAFHSPGESWNVKDLADRYKPLVSLDGGPSFARMSMGGAQVSLEEYQRYCTNNADGDNTPLYVFDPAFLKPESTFANGDFVSQEFSIPNCFSNDEMACCNGSRFRPLPPAWLLVGAALSGTPIHNHPMTVAWNALLSGCKLWCCLPPNVPESALLLHFQHEDGDGGDNEEEEDHEFDLSALQWFEQCGELPDDARIIVQHPGEVVFLPAGWFHVVLNCQLSTAISVSLTLRRDLADVMPLLADEDEEFHAFWMDQLAL